MKDIYFVRFDLEDFTHEIKNMEIIDMANLKVEDFFVKIQKHLDGFKDNFVKIANNTTGFDLAHSKKTVCIATSTPYLDKDGVLTIQCSNDLYPLTDKQFFDIIEFIKEKDGVNED